MESNFSINVSRREKTSLDYTFMDEQEIQNRRWQIFSNIIDKQNLDLKAENMRDYLSNFKSAYNKAVNIVNFFDNCEMME